MTPDSRKIRLVLELRAGGVSDRRVLGAMERVPRELFVPEPFRDKAYDNVALPIGHHQTVSQPLVVGLMTQALEVGPRMKVLEIGTGSGYQAAVLAAMGANTYSMEIKPNLAREVKIRLKKLGYKVEVRQGDGYYGWIEHAPFDRIIITAAANHVPRPLLDQLKLGGKLILPLGNVRYSQNMTLIEKDSQGKMHTSQHGQVRFVPMVGVAQE